MPERLAHLVAVPLGLAVAEPPFGRVELIETLWWHPDRATTPEHAWLRRTLTEVARPIPAEADLLVRAGGRVIGTDVLDDEGAAHQIHLAQSFPGLFEYRQLDVSRPGDWDALAADL